jgi:tetratricopeptide (TPR) repeat protein
LEPKKLSALLHGELDWIVMKSLEKERSRRYETANGLAMDVQRYLDDEAVQACPPSARYRFGKFARRNRAVLVTVLLVVAALLAGTAVATWQAVVATRAKQNALAAAVAEKEAKQTAEAREAEARAVLDFVQNKIFAAARPEGQAGGLGREVTLRRAIEAALPFVEASFTNQPLIEARLRMTLGTSFSYLGEAGIAAEQFQKARALYTEHRGPDHPDTLRSMGNLAVSYRDLGRHVDALKLSEETLALMKAKLGPDHPDTLASMNNLATIYSSLGRHAEALKLREETLALRKAKLGPGHPDTLSTMYNLATTYASLGRHADALRLREETLALMKAKLGADHPNTLLSMWCMAKSLVELDRGAEAVPIIDECVRRAAGKDVDSSLIPGVMELRLRHYEQIRDAAGCLQTAGMWEALKRIDAESLYQSAYFRALCAAVIKATDQTPAGEARAKEQADLAMAWLKQAVAAGYKDVEEMKQDEDLDALRDRADFKQLLSIAGAKQSTTTPTTTTKSQSR